MVLISNFNTQKTKYTMFENELSAHVIKKVSIVESFFNPLDNRIKKAFKELWIEHFNQPASSFYKRIAKPQLEDYALIIYFLGVKNDYTFLVEFYKDAFKTADGEAYPTLKSIMDTIPQKKSA
jgi:hypothetical protein